MVLYFLLKWCTHLYAQTSKIHVKVRTVRVVPLTGSTEQTASWEVNTFLASQEIPGIL